MDPKLLHNEQSQLKLLLALAFVLRLAFFVTHSPYDSLSHWDSFWYVKTGWLILHNALPATLSQVGPLYPLLLAAIWILSPSAPFPQSIQDVPLAFVVSLSLIQIVMSVLMVGLCYQVSKSLTASHPAGLIAAIGVGVGPAFVMEPSLILTETVFMTLLVLAVWLYGKAFQSMTVRGFALAGVAFGLAALTRPILLAFPFVLVPHVLMSFKAHARIIRTCALLGGFCLVLLPWFIYLDLGTGRWFPDGLSSNLWIGTVGRGKFEGPQATDRLRQGMDDSNASYIRAASQNIGRKPFGWLSLHARNFVEAILQPHGTDNFPDLKIKQTIWKWMEYDRSLSGLWSIVQIPGFWARTAIYIFHYAALVFGTLGAWISRHSWRKLYMPFSFILYSLLIYGILTVSPRYLFPVQIFFWIFAGIAVAESRAINRKGRK